VCVCVFDRKSEVTHNCLTVFMASHTVCIMLLVRPLGVLWLWFICREIKEKKSFILLVIKSTKFWADLNVVFYSNDYYIMEVLLT